MSPSRPSHASHLVEIDLKSGCKIEKCTQFKLWERCIDLKLCMLQNREMRTIKTLGEMCHRAQGLAWWRSLYESPPQHPLILSPTFAFDQMWGKGPGVFSSHLYIYTSFLFNHWYAWGTIWICIMGNHAYRWFKLHISAEDRGRGTSRRLSDSPCSIYSLLLQSYVWALTGGLPRGDRLGHRRVAAKHNVNHI